MRHVLLLAACVTLASCAMVDQEAPAGTPERPKIVQIDGRWIVCGDCIAVTPKTAGRPLPSPPIAHSAPAQQPVALEPLPVADVPPSPALRGARRLERASLRFGMDRRDVSAEAQATLGELMPLVRASSRIRVVGFTDSTGSQAANDAIATARALAVQQELKKRLGDAPTPELVPIGMPLCCYLLPNTTSAGRDRNRRVELLMEIENTSVGEALIQRHAGLLEGPVGENWPDRAAAQEKGGKQ